MTPKSLRLLDYSVWAPESPPMSPLPAPHNVCLSGDSIPKLSFLPLMQRRRLSPLGRVVMASLYPLYERNRKVISAGRGACVFSSRWGDIAVTVKSLEQLTGEKSVSPTAFSTSVHNAIGGLFSLFEHFHGNITSLSGGRAGISAALFEARGLIQEHDFVLMSIYEDETPDVFKAWHQSSRRPYAITLLFSNSEGVPIEAAPLSGVHNCASENPVPDFLRFISAQKNSFSETDGLLWIRK